MARRTLRICFLVGVAVTLAAYARAPEVGFFFDDRQNVELAAGVHWTELSVETMRGLRDSTLMPQRVVANATFGLNHLVGGLDPWGYHVVNIVVHLAVGMALAWVAWLYLLTVLPGRDRDTLALAAGVPVVVFLVHPLNTQAVTYVVQRMTSLAALFCLLAFGTFLVGRSKPRVREAWRWYALAAVAWMLALGSKENAVLLPLVLVTYEWCFRREEWTGRWRALTAGQRSAVGVGGLVLLAAAVIAVLGYAGGNPLQWTGTFRYRDFSPLERMLTELRVQVFYVGLLLWPTPGRLSLDHDFVVSRGLLTPPTTLVAGLFWLAVLATGLVLAARRPGYGFPLLAYLEWHLLESGPVNLELVFEHRMYLPMTMLVLGMAVGLAALSERRRHVATVVTLVLVLPLAWSTWRRNQVWADPEAFYWDTARKAPSKARPWFNLGTLLLKWDRPAEAVEPLEHALEADPADWRIADQLGLAYLGVGQTDRALATFRSALEVKPDEFEPALHIGTALELRGSTREAAQHLLNVGTARGMAGDAMMALLALQRSVALDSTNSLARNSLGNAYLLVGRSDEALAQYREATRLDPANFEALFNAGMLLAEQGEREAAIGFLERFAAAAPPHLATQVAAARTRIRILRGPQ